MVRLLPPVKTTRESRCITIKKYNIIDLFSGAGGLSLGFMQTNRVHIVAAAESNNDARKTYQRNFQVSRIYSDVRDIDYDKLKLDTSNIDIVIGGPPCQGFSKANRQHSTIISMNNRLIKEYVRAVLKLKPKAFLMENVAMLKSNVHRFMLEEIDLNNTKLKSIKQTTDSIEILADDVCFEGALDFIKSLAHMDPPPFAWDDSLYKIVNLLYRYRINQPKFDVTLKRHSKKLFPKLYTLKEKEFHLSTTPIEYADALMADNLLTYISCGVDFEGTIDSIKKAIMLQRAIARIKELHDNGVHIFEFRQNFNGIFATVKSFSVRDYINTMFSDEYILSENTLNALDYGAPQRRERFILVGIRRSLNQKYEVPPTLFQKGTYHTVKDAISDLQSIPASLDNTENYVQLPPLLHPNDLMMTLRGERLYNHVATKTKGIALERFRALKEGQNFHDLDDKLKTTYSNAGRTQNTIYKRLKYDEPCGTVVNVRKSMWVHPELDRAISIREAARLQTFPDSFVFEGSKDHQYQQVGNAVPPLLAKEIAKSIIAILDKTL